MNFGIIFLTLVLALANAERGSKRNKRLLSLFNVVKFQNERCDSQSVAGGEIRSGSCLTTTECRDRGGMMSGSCAAGFGACCLFVQNTCGGRITQNCTYVRNPEFPATYDDEDNCMYTIEKCEDDICQFRLDFLTFTILGPNDENEVMGGICNQDTFNVNGNAGDLVPTICGENAGQHLYIDVGPEAGASAELAFDFTGMDNTRTWEIKVSQISCFANCKAPPGCLQWFTGCTGVVSTFNFNNNMGRHLADQCYNACIRQEEGMCCVKYRQCDNNQFNLDDGIKGANSATEELCQSDFVIIEGSSSDCCIGPGALTQRYCGKQLNDISNIATSVEICDCTPPFAIGFETDNMPDAGGAGVLGMGVCLQYTQVPCGIP